MHNNRPWFFFFFFFFCFKYAYATADQQSAIAHIPTRSFEHSQCELAHTRDQSADVVGRDVCKVTTWATPRTPSVYRFWLLGISS